jgi:hypothetical protein
MSQTEKTKENYQRRANLLIKKFEKETHIEWKDNPLSVCEWLVASKPTISKSTWRQYKASLKYYMKNYGPVEAVEYIDKQTSHGALRKTHRTSGCRKKSITKKEYESLLKEFLRKTSEVDELVILYMKNNIIFGLRPHEWFTASIKNNHLVVINGKNTNGRANGFDRKINLGFLKETDMNNLEIFLSLIKNFLEKYSKEQLQKKISNRIYRAVKKLWPKDVHRITPYSTRHQASANFKFNEYTPEMVAGLMGHNSTETAQSHYGKRRSGYKTDKKILPHPDELKKLQDKMKSVNSPDIKEI